MNIYNKHVVSALLGIILGCLIMQFAYPQTIAHGPDSNEIKKQIYFNMSDQSCYRFVPQSYVCPLYLLKNGET